MKEEKIEDFIEQSFRDGYTVEEIQELLREEGVSEAKIEEAVADLNRKLKQRQQSQGSDRSQEKDAHSDIIKKVDLTDDSYTVKQRLFLNRYHVYTESDELVLKAKQKLFRLKEEIPFMDSENNVVFHVKAESMIDAGGDYTVVDEETEEPVVVLDRKYTLFRHRWRIRDPETEELLCRVHSQNQTLELLRWIGNLLPYFPNILAFLPHTYEIEGQQGEKIGELAGKFSLRDIYDLNIEESGSIPKEALISGAIAIDALEGN